MTLLDDPRPISADSHALEGPEVFDGLAERFVDAGEVDHRETIVRTPTLVFVLVFVSTPGCVSLQE